MSPRQKMINMMYLVLMALLALNVSKEILKSFHLFEQSFNNAAKNIDSKNTATMGALQKQMEKNPGKTKPYFERAQKAQKIADDFVSYINRIVEKVGFKFRKVIHWHKTNPFPAIHTRKMYANSMEMMVHFSKGSPKTWNHKPVNEMHNFIQTPICMGKERKKHKTQKPLKVCIPYIEISSNEGEIVLDPFMGSGTTAIACLKTNRKYIGYEINPEYHKIIKERIYELDNPPPPKKKKKPEA